VTSRQRYIALGAASVVVATAIGAALIPAAPPVDENELEDLRSTAPSAASKTPEDAEIKGPETHPNAGPEAYAVKEAMPEVANQASPTPINTPPASSSRPYAILPGSQVSLPTEAALEITARAAVAVELVLEQGATQLTLRPGDRIVLMSGRAERVEVSDRNAVEVAMAGKPVQLAPVAPPTAGNSPGQNPNRGVWTIAAR
jgi:hypothetical protein